MTEQGSELQELYAQFKAAEQEHANVVGATISQSRLPLVGGVIDRISSKNRERVAARLMTTVERKIIEISQNIRETPGRYPLETVRGNVRNEEFGFGYSFRRYVGKDSFVAAFWDNNRWGLLMQRHPEDGSPEIVVQGRSERDLSLLYLPEGFKIPVGPIQFEEEGTPMTQEELSAQYEKIVRSIESNSKAMIKKHSLDGYSLRKSPTGTIEP